MRRWPCSTRRRPPPRMCRSCPVPHPTAGKESMVPQMRPQVQPHRSTPDGERERRSPQTRCEKHETRTREPAAQGSGDLVTMVRARTAHSDECDHRRIHRHYACAETRRADPSINHMAEFDDRGDYRHPLGHRTQPLPVPRQTSRRKRRKTQAVDASSQKTRPRRSRYVGGRGMLLFVLVFARTSAADASAGAAGVPPVDGLW